MLLISLLTIAFISACSSTSVEHRTILVTKPSSIPCRVVQHAMGQTCVLHHSQRIVTLLHHTLGHALALDIKPIGSNVRSVEQLSGDYLDVDTYLGNKAEGIKALGIEFQVSLERILLLKPDLILATEFFEDIYPLLSQIAPVVIVPFKDAVFNWKEGFNFIAEVFGKETEAQQALNHYYQQIEELKKALGDHYKNQDISIAGSAGGSTMFAFTKPSFADSILRDLELQRPKAQNIVTPHGAIYNISEERLEQVDGDILFFLNFGHEGRAAFERLRQRPLWKTIKAVQKNQVYLVDGYTWTGSNLLAADAVIDDLYKYLVNTP